MRKIVLRVDRKHSALEDAAIVLDQGKQQMIFILLFTVLYLFRDLAGANIPDIVFSGLCAAAFMMADVGTALGMYIFTTALTVPHNEIRIVYLVIVFAKMFFSGVMRINGKMLLMTLGAMLLQLMNVTMFSADGVEDVVYDYISKMLIFVLPLVWFNEEYSSEDFRSALMCYVVGVLLGGTVTLILTAERISWEALLKGTGGNRLGKTFSADETMHTTYNANQLAIMFAISASVILQRIDKKRISKAIGFAMVGYLLFLVVLTRSRTGLLMMAMIVLVYYLVLVFRRKRIFSGMALLAMIGALVFLVITLMPGAVEKLMNRFVDQEDITNGRADTFVFYIQKWVEKPWGFLFGYGIGSYFDIVEVGISPHNAITDILISWGLFGLLLVAGIIAMCWSKGIKGVDKKDRMMALLPAIVALVASMAGQYLTTGYPHMRQCFLFLAAKAWSSETPLLTPAKENDK